VNADHLMDTVVTKKKKILPMLEKKGEKKRRYKVVMRFYSQVD